MMVVRRYEPGDEGALWQLYHDTTHIVNGRDYTPEQCERWAPAIPDIARWTERIRDRNPFVAELDGTIVGFAELLSDGEIDFFYVHHEHQREGVRGAGFPMAVRVQVPVLVLRADFRMAPIQSSA
ncbi:MAG: GNAT family N-acetyltransferase [Chitinivibrionales bacterium]|nr:GNAT family N-acetyltransferase [Chitinivibrionales bacterium]